jgi:hypothetical protein
MFAAAAISMASIVSANDSAPRSDVEARLDKLEIINVTAQKPAKNDDAPDPELDAILQAAAQAEAQGEAQAAPQG